MLSPRAVAVVAILAASLAALLSRRVRHDLVGVATALALVAVGAVSPQQLLSDLASPAVVVMASAMVIAGILAESGIMDVVGDRLALSSRGELLTVIGVLLLAALASGFVSDVALTLALMPAVYSLARRLNRPAGRYLMPLAYAAILGGRYTMIGTSSNVVLESLWIQRFGFQLPILEPLRLGLVEVVISVVAVALAAPLLLRGAGGGGVRSLEDLSKVEAIVEVRIPSNSPFVGKNVRELERALGVRALVGPLERRSGLREGQVIAVRVPHDRLPVLMSSKEVETQLSKGPFYELLVTPDSDAIGMTVYEVNARLRDARVVGVSTGSRFRGLRRHVLRPGDVVLVEGSEEEVTRAAQALGLVPLGSRIRGLDRGLARSALIGLAIAVGASLAGVNVALSFMAGALVALLLSPNIIRRAQAFVELPTLIFVGTYLTMGQALASSGIASALPSQIVTPPALFALSLLFANLVGNAASAILVGPLAVNSPHPLAAVMAVAMGASSTFLTPFSHPANLVVYSAAGYSPRDYVKVGLVPVILVALLTLWYLGALP